MLTCFVLFVMLCSGSLIGAVFFQNKFEEALPVTTSALALILFFFGLAGILELGVYFILFSVVVIYLVCLIHLFRKKACSNIAQRLFTPGFLIFVVTFFVLLYLNYDRYVHEWDELSHWALIVKSMATYDALGTGENSGVLFKSYPPIMALFQYLFFKIFQLVGKQEFKDWFLYFAYQLFALSFLFPFLASASWKRFAHGLLIFLSLCLVPMLFFPNFYHCLYIDPFLGVVGACAWALLLDSSKISSSHLTQICMYSAVLVLSKDVGTVLAIFLAAGYISRLWLDRRSCPRSVKTDVFRSILAIGSVALPKILWSQHLNAMNVSRSFSNPVDFHVLMDVLRGQDTSYRHQVLLNYLDAWFTKYISFGKLGITLSYGLLLLILPLAILLAVYLGNRAALIKTKNLTVLTSIVLLQHIVYAVGLCVIYMFKFSEYESLLLASFERYINIVFLLDFLLLFLLLARLISQLSIKTSVLILAATLVLSPLGRIRALVDGWDKYLSYEISEYYNVYTNLILNEIEEGSKVFLISQEDNGYDYQAFRYHFFPQIPPRQDNLWSVGPSFYEGDIWSVDLSTSELSEILKQYDYVFVFSSNDYLGEYYGALFNEPEKISAHTLFEVEKTSGRLSHVLSLPF